MGKLNLVAAVLAMTALPTVPASAQPALSRAAQPNVSEAKARVTAAWAKIAQSGFSGAVRIDIGNEVILRTAAGFADPATRRPFSPDEQFEMGSLTKAFTAAAILKLQDQGKLSVKDPLSKFFPNVPADKAGITLHQLLTHSAGFPLVVPPVAAASDLEPIDRNAFVARAFAAPLLFAPGARLEYSNSGYGLLAAVVELVSGQSYEEFLKSQVLAPAGATHTGYGSVLVPATAARARDGQTIRDCCWGKGGPYWNLVGNGGLVSTLDDFVTWRKAFAAGRIVSPAAATQAATGWVNERNGDGKEGYGWIVGTSSAHGRIEEAAGGSPYFVTEMRYYPDYGITTLVTTNGDQSPGMVASQLVAALFGEAPPSPMAITSAGSPEERSLMTAFSEALLNPDAAARRAFLEKNVGPAFRQREGIEVIATRFDALHAELDGAAAGGVGSTLPGEGTLTFIGKDGTRRKVTIRFGGSPDAPRVANFAKAD
jgi:CubicO group peptidase (beta-lactamase class C family)